MRKRETLAEHHGRKTKQKYTSIITGLFNDTEMTILGFSACTAVALRDQVKRTVYLRTGILFVLYCYSHLIDMLPE